MPKDQTNLLQKEQDLTSSSSREDQISPETLLPTDEIIKIAKEHGVDFGPGDPHERIRYFIKLELLPHQTRKTEVKVDSQSQENSNLTVNSAPVGHLPYWTVKRLAKIDRWFKAGVSYPQIAEKFKRIERKRAREAWQQNSKVYQLTKATHKLLQSRAPRAESFLTKATVSSIIALVLVFGALLASLAIGGQKVEKFLQVQKTVMIPARETYQQESPPQGETLGIKEQTKTAYDKFYRISSDVISIVLSPLTNLAMVMIYGPTWDITYQFAQAPPPEPSPPADIDLGDNYLTVSPQGNIAELKVTGQTILGTEFTDYITVNGSFKSDLLPATTAKYNLGSGGERWRTGYFSDNVFVGSELKVSSDGITTKGSQFIKTTNGGSIYLEADSGTVYLGKGTNTLSNADTSAITIDPNGTGAINFHSSANNIDSSGNLVIAGNLTIGGITISTGAGPLTITSTTTPQLSVRYDASNYWTSSVSSTGAVTFDAVGTGAAFTISDAVTASSTLTVTGTTTLNGQGIAARAPTSTHTGTWAIDSSTWNVDNATFYINPSSATADSNLLGLAVAGGVKFAVDAEGDVFGRNLVLTGSTTTGTTTITGNLSVEGNTTLGDSTTDTLTINPATVTLAGGNKTIDITGAATRTLTILNSTASQVADLNLSDGDLQLGGTVRIANAGAGTLTDLTLSGDAAVNGGDITTTATTFNLVNATATTVNFAGAATTIGIGASSGTFTVNNATLSFPNATALNCSDCIDFDDLTDAMTIDATTTIDYTGAITALALTNSGAKTDTSTGVYLANTSTSATAGINKYALRLSSTGSWSGTSAYAIAAEIQPVTGGTNNVALCFDCDGTWTTSTVASGIQFGTDANGVNLYRSASDTLKTDDAFVVGGASLTIGTNPAAGGAIRIPYQSGANGLVARNSANNGDINLIGNNIDSVDSGSVVEIGQTSTDLYVYEQIKLNNNKAFGSRNAAGNNYIDIFRLDTSDGLLIGNGTITPANITFGKSGSNVALNFYSGTSVQTFSSAVATGTTTSSAFVFTDSSLTSGTGVYITATGLTSGTEVSLIPGTAMTTGSAFAIGSGTYNHGASETGSLSSITFTDATNLDAAATTTTNGLNVASTVNVTGGVSSSGTKTVSALNVAAPTFTACSGGSNACTWQGLNISQTAPTSTITSYGINVSGATTPSSSTIYGVAIGNITAGAGTETAVNIGSGWDTDIAFVDSTVIVDGPASSSITFQDFTTITASSVTALNCSDCIDFNDMEDTLALDANLTLNQTTSTWSQTFTGGTTIGLSYAANSLTTGTALAISSADTTAFNGELLRLTKTSTGSATAFTADIAKITYSQTFTSGVGLDSTGNVMDILRTITLNNLGNTHTISGALVTIANSATQQNGTLNVSGDVLRLAENYDSANATGTTLNITTAATGTGALALRVNDDGTFTDSTPFVIDASGNVGIGTATPSQKVQIVGTITSSSTNARGLLVNPTLDGSGDGPGGISAQPTFAPSANIGSAYGLINIGTANPAAGITITGMYAGFYRTDSASGSAGTLTNAYTNYSSAPIYSGIKPTNQYGMRIANQGVTGITSAYGLYVEAQSGATNNFMIYMGGAPTTANTAGLCWDNSADSAIYDCNGTPTDLAENFGTTDAAIEAGDIVSTDPNRPAQAFLKPDDHGNLTHTSRAYIVKTEKPYDSSILGIVSTQPNQVYGDDGVFDPSENPRPVSLAGRVPVKVSTENGAIAVDDPITSSSTVGVGMRATKAGRVVGVALENFDPQTADGQTKKIDCPTGTTDGTICGKILVFVNLTWYLGVNLASNGSLGSLASGQVGENSNPQTYQPTSLLAFDLLNPDGTLTAQYQGQILTADQVQKLVAEEVTRQLASNSASHPGEATTSIGSQDSIASLQNDSEATSSAEASSSATAASDAAALAQQTDQTLAELNSLLSTVNLELSTLQVTDNSQLAQTQVAGTFSQDGTLIIDYGRQINVLGSTLYLQNDSIAGDAATGLLVDIGGGKVTIDRSGNVKIEGTLTAREIATEKLTIDTSSPAKPTVGSSSILPGQISKFIETTAVTEGAKILVTATTQTNGKSLYVSQKSDFEGFTVSLDPALPATTSITFDWFIINTKQLSAN